MSNLKEMIEEFCPEGVEYKRISECILPIQNIKWKTSNETYQYIDLSSVDRDTHRITETVSINSDNAPSRAQQIVRNNDILLGTTRPMLKRYCLVGEDYDGQICSTGYCVLRPNTTIISPDWLFHVIASTEFFNHVERYQKGASYPSISDSETKMYKMPVPPYPVQEAIVKILNHFAKSSMMLTTELASELFVRKKQYYYYREKMLTFDSSVRQMTIGQIAKVTIGEFVHKNKQNAQAKYPVYNGGTTNTGYYDEYNREANRVIISARGANAGFVNRVFTRYWSGNSCYTIEINDSRIDWNYVYFWLKTNEEKLIGDQQRGGIPAVSKKQVESFAIAVPDLEKQKHIVAILEKYEKSIDGITDCLSAEINARQKQYEFYRDKLLSFKQSEVVL